jgi:hypothetical protein
LAGASGGYHDVEDNIGNAFSAAVHGRVVGNAGGAGGGFEDRRSSFRTPGNMESVVAVHPDSVEFGGLIEVEVGVGFHHDVVRASFRGRWHRHPGDAGDWVIRVIGGLEAAGLGGGTCAGVLVDVDPGVEVYDFVGQLKVAVGVYATKTASRLDEIRVGIAGRRIEVASGQVAERVPDAVPVARRAARPPSGK